MGRTEKKLLGKNAQVIIDFMKKAYSDEMRIFHYFWYVGINMEGIGLHRNASGETILTLISDDNFLPFQRTLLLQFALVGDP